MAYRTIVVHIDNSARCVERIDVAARLARDFDAHLVGLYVAMFPHLPGSPAHITQIDVADWLISRAFDTATDLIVMGAYGHSVTRERLFGGVTRSVLGQMTVPVLMAH